jgi:hypothetical protein
MKLLFVPLVILPVKIVLILLLHLALNVLLKMVINSIKINALILALQKHSLMQIIVLIVIPIVKNVPEAILTITALNV